jgi:hypothetical protein
MPLLTFLPKNHYANINFRAQAQTKSKAAKITAKTATTTATMIVILFVSGKLGQVTLRNSEMAARW